jgi:hypothetical protein
MLLTGPNFEVIIHIIPSSLSSGHGRLPPRTISIPPFHIPHHPTSLHFTTSSPLLHPLTISSLFIPPTDTISSTSASARTSMCACRSQPPTSPAQQALLRQRRTIYIVPSYLHQGKPSTSSQEPRSQPRRNIS